MLPLVPLPGGCPAPAASRRARPANPLFPASPRRPRAAWLAQGRCWRLLALLLALAGPALAQPTNIPGPAGSGSFGITVTVLPNSNFVVTDPGYDNGTILDVGAVYLYDGRTYALLSTLTGSIANDRVGGGTTTVLPNGHYVVGSSWWNNGAATNAGAVTWGNSSTGVSGVVSAANSLVGSSANDQVGVRGFTILPNGHYLVHSTRWANGTGALTWGNASTGVSGVVSAANSLVGSSAGDGVGFTSLGQPGVTALPNGHYVVRSPNWANGTAANAGAVTWGNGSTGVSGVVSAANSLVGSSANDYVGNGGITVLPNSHYVVRTSSWANGAGAVTWGNGSTGVSGVVSAANSLVGASANDQVGNGGIAVLTNGHYVVRSSYWANGTLVNAGAATWGNSSTGVRGVVSAVNSLVGSSAGDAVGSSGVTVLPNGHYVVRTPNWTHGAASNAGAATWGNGNTGVRGAVSAANSLVGSTANDNVSSSGITTLATGHYVVGSPNWDNGTLVNTGAVTWGNGSLGTSGAVSAANSLVGSTSGDNVGSSGITALSNGNYVVGSPNWDNGTLLNTGAVTWGNGNLGTSGAVSAANSWVGSTAFDQVSSLGITALSMGHYVVSSPNWDNGTVVNAGAITWGNGSTRTSGVVSAANSLVGSSAGDFVSNGGIKVLPNGHYLVSSASWANGVAVAAGAVTWGNGGTGVSGAVSAANSLVGTTAGDFVGNLGITVLSNGNYVVSSFFWDNGTVVNAGAVTWGNGDTGVRGVVSAANSLVGSSANDQVGGTTVLPNGHYVVSSSNWDNGAVNNAGAATWGNGNTGVRGAVSAANSLVGSSSNDRVSYPSVTAQSDGNYLVQSNNWDNGLLFDAGAVTLGSGSAGTSGPVSTCNSIAGRAVSWGSNLAVAYQATTATLLAGMYNENRVQVGTGAAAAPTGAASQRFPLGATVADLVATGTAVQWFAAPASGSALASATPLVDGSTYYAGQTVGGCPGFARLPVVVAVGGPLSASPGPIGGTEQAAGLVVYPTVGAAGQPVRYAYTGPALAAGTRLEVVDVLGRPVWAGAAGAAAGVLPVVGLGSGWYLLRLRTATGSQQARFYQP